MTKNELKVGMLAQFRNGKIKMIMPCRTEYILIDKDGIWLELKHYTDDLRCKYNSDIDIIKVWDTAMYTQHVFNFDTYERELIWERKEKRKMTVAEIENILGYEVEIISEKGE